MEAWAAASSSEDDAAPYEDGSDVEAGRGGVFYTAFDSLSDWHNITIFNRKLKSNRTCAFNFKREVDHSAAAIPSRQLGARFSIAEEQNWGNFWWRGKMVRNIELNGAALPRSMSLFEGLIDWWKQGIAMPSGTRMAIHPLDVLCVLLHCSDNFLQQEIVSKMSMCQFAVPLLLPAVDGSNCTLMLWKMRDIVKRWRPQSLEDSKRSMEDNVVNIRMPTFSFARMGKAKLSKSKILNHIINPTQQLHDFFIHDNMEGGNIKRKVSDGLVEMSWYFPSGSENSDIFPEPIAVTNLRGDLESNRTQFNFLTRVSSAVFIFTESIREKEFRLLSNCDKDTKYYFIITPNMEKDENMKKLNSVLNIEIISKPSSLNDKDLVKKIKSKIKLSVEQSPFKISIENMGKQTYELDIQVDEFCEECCKAKIHAGKIVDEIKDVAQYKKESLSLQGDLWKQISEKEKEMFRQREKESKNDEEYQEELNYQCIQLRKKQYDHNISNGMQLFIEAISTFSSQEKHYFLRWMKYYLDLLSRNTLSGLLLEYRTNCENQLNQEELKQLDQKKYESSLGIEHFLREMGQVFEAECFMLKNEKIQMQNARFSKLPDKVADLLLKGFSLELIDGDASNIPLRWITDVLTELNTKTGERCRMRVITVLGVQGTGKSTLLNNMFGLQFPVASGRCTRGAFMTLIGVKKNLQKELGCDYILVIDTEGLKAPELASLEDSSKHDYELATLVVTLSDITIVNMVMDNTEESKSILQIVLHAFLKMKEKGKKLKCQFVHQKVDMSDEITIIRHKSKFQELLNEITKIAAKEENKPEISKFESDLDFNINTDNRYIPNMWYSAPLYNEEVFKLKTYLIDSLKKQTMIRPPLNIKEFITWINDLGNAVRHDKFINTFGTSYDYCLYKKLPNHFISPNHTRMLPNTQLLLGVIYFIVLQGIAQPPSLSCGHNLMQNAPSWTSLIGRGCNGKIDWLPPKVTQHITELCGSMIKRKQQEKCLDSGPPSVRYSQHSSPAVLKFSKRKHFEELLQQLGMGYTAHSKLTLKRILNIGKENYVDINSQNVQDIPWNFLNKLLALNRTARNTHCDKYPHNRGPSEHNSLDTIMSTIFYTNGEKDNSSSLNPLDVLCVLLHCSDTFLQQEIVLKMSMCQFAVPLLLPASDSPCCMLMLWALRDIVKRWRPQSLAARKGFMEENVVSIPMSIYSFVRLGKTKLSKSKILNQVLSPAQQNLDFFIHDNMHGGNMERKISNGLVEMSWYFPSGSESSDIFPEPLAVTNLRGELESNWTQFIFLTRVSSAVFIFTESIGEREFRLLSNINSKDTIYYFIITPRSREDVNMETRENLQKLISVLKLDIINIILKKNTDNDTALMKRIQSCIHFSLMNNPKRTTMQSMEKQIDGLDICVDENSEECQKAREHVLEITGEIKDVIQYKKETMSLQGDLWKQVSQIEKEMCRMKNQGTMDTQIYQSELRRQRISLREKQHDHDLPKGIMLFINAIVYLSQTEKQYFLKWMKFELDSIARDNLSTLQAEYKEKYNNPQNNKEELKHLDQKISDSSLGIEHFLREMGQFYEAENSLYSAKKNQDYKKQFMKLPKIAADLLWGGFPLELIDGDASNISLQWITDVLTELDTKTGGRCRMRVITVLGVQSTGKSTILNTMFGLQFPVASGRCTRGAFMTLIKVEDDFQEEMGCNFILVIDTEGLKAPELASLEDSHEHDNELATLVVGLSDITLINMAMENTAEMKDILQIVVHAFLRMKEIGKKPKCQFVHQNVSDVSAHEKNARDRKKLLEQLDEMTKIAANMETKYGITKFSDVMDYDIENDSWYIPGLWHGVPPMAPVNSGYSESTSVLKKYLLDFMKTCKSINKSMNIQEFITWINSLWNAVKHERFLFSFRNSLVAEAYNKLSIQFSQWEWDFTKAVHSWVINTETLIRNQSADKLNNETFSCYKNKLNEILFEEENKLSESLKRYFENNSENVHLIEKYKKDFFLSVEFLKKELERNAINKCNEAFHIQKGKFEIQGIQNKYQKVIEDKVMNLLQICRERNHQISISELEGQFEAMWGITISDLQIDNLKRRDINQSVLQQLRNNTSNKGSEINNVLLKVTDLHEHENTEFSFKKHYIDDSFLKKFIKFFTKQEYSEQVSEFAKSLIEMCAQYVTEKVNIASDYDDTYCQELLRLIDEKLENKDIKNCTLPLRLCWI
ncbi:up-regulator of cell proliferation-like [Pelobates cultripes]|uniref:Up-regulator of cell proliferation-like n=1 Tax=Pelobates cultripes TaxID=61616 RepID=A0AAD1SQU0_PELCU|nr:up-regulator of cell proliferation-like [Pelobates cultripes]